MKQNESNNLQKKGELVDGKYQGLYKDGKLYGYGICKENRLKTGIIKEKNYIEIGEFDYYGNTELMRLTDGIRITNNEKGYGCNIQFVKDKKNKGCDIDNVKKDNKGKMVIQNYKNIDDIDDIGIDFLKIILKNTKYEIDEKIIDDFYKKYQKKT